MPTKKRGAKSSSKKRASRRRVSAGGKSALQRAANDYMEALVKYGLFQGTRINPQVTPLLENIHRVLAGNLKFKSEDLQKLMDELIAEFQKAGGTEPIEILSC
jgi:hypothetical protein